MNIQILYCTTTFCGRPFILFYLLFLLPCLLLANPVTSSENIFIQNETSKVMFCAAPWQHEPLVNDTTLHPGTAASSSDYVEATYPGGASAWLRHLMKTFRYP